MEQENAVVEHKMRVRSQSRMRTRSVGTKITESDYPALAACASALQMNVAEWVRYVLLAAARQSVAVRAGASGAGSGGGGEYMLLLAELCAFRAAVLNVLFAMAKGEPLTVERMQELIARADAGAAQRAAKLQEAA
jgi:hypothetical protein